MSEIDRNKPIPQEGLIHLDGVGLLVSFITALELERERQELTKTALAELLGVAPARITEWTSGRVQPGLDMIERWIRVLGLRVTLEPARQSRIDPDQLTLDQLAKFVWAVKYKSRRVAKSVLSEALAGEHATSADVDTVQAYITKREDLEKIEYLAETSKAGFEKG